MKTNKGLVEYCFAQLGRPYWMGATGQISSEWLYNYLRNRSDIRQYYTATDFMQQLGVKVHDCIGLVKGYMWSPSPDEACDVDYDICPDLNADGMLSYCTEKGPISTIPDVPGVLVFYSGHVGVYVGSGEVIEARGHRYGVVKTVLAGRGWRNWGKCPVITYEEDDDMDLPRFKELYMEMRRELQDNDKSEYSDEAIAWCIKKGLLKGAGDTAKGKPNYMYEDILTREQACVLFYRFAKELGLA